MEVRKRFNRRILCRRWSADSYALRAAISRFPFGVGVFSESKVGDCMSGFVVARQLRQTRPGLDAILIARLDKPGEACERYPIKKPYNHSLGNSARIARSRSFANELGRTKVEVLDSRASPLQLGSDSKRTILLVEDHFDTRWCAASYLRLVGYRVLEAVNANEAFDLVNSGIDIDLVFSDVNMPGAKTDTTWHGGSLSIAQPCPCY